MRVGRLLILPLLCLQAADIPMTLVSVDEAEPIHSAIIRRETWTQDAVHRLRAEADKRMKEGPWSVTFDRPPGLDLDPHDYYSEAPYWWPDPDHPGGPYIRKDGRTNTGRYLANKNALNAMADTVFTLGTAAFLMDNPQYAQRAARVVNTWFINPKTRMNPSLEYAQGIPGANTGRPEGILDARVFIPAIQGMEFLAETGAWDPKEQAAAHKWFEDYLRWLTHSKMGDDEKHSGNNHASWYVAQQAAIATFVSDAAEQQAAFAFYRDVILRQFRADGSAPREEARTRSLSYSAFNLEACATICRIAQLHNVDLWNARAKNGPPLAAIIDYLAPFLSDPHKWPKEQVGDFQSDSAYSLAFAGMGLKKPEYVALYRKLERPGGAWSDFVDLVVGRWEAAAHQTRH